MIHNGSPTCRLLVQEETTRYMNDESDYTLLWKFPFTLRHLHVPSTPFLSGSWGRTELFLVFYCQFCIALIIPRHPFLDSISPTRHQFRNTFQFQLSNSIPLDHQKKLPKIDQVGFDLYHSYFTNPIFFTFYFYHLNFL